MYGHVVDANSINAIGSIDVALEEKASRRSRLNKPPIPENGVSART